MSIYMAQRGRDHRKAIKWILRYLNGIVNCGLIYGKAKSNNNGLRGYVDSKYVEDLD